MRTISALLMLCMFLLSSTGAIAQSMDDRLKALEETLKKQEQTIQELKALQSAMKAQEQTISEQRKVIEELKAEIKQPPAAASPAATAAKEPEATGTIREQVKELKEKVEQVAEAQRKEVLSVFNPSIGLVGETIFSHNNRTSAQTGSVRPGGYDVNMRSIELNLAASVDPFAKGYAVFNASVDPVTGEATSNVEEAAIQTTSLPWNLSVKAGRFFGEFGRLSYIHDHELPFVNRPLALDQYIGGESKTDGVQVNYLLPIPHYVSLTLGAGTQFGGTPNNVGGYRGSNNLNYFGRASTYFDLTPDISFEPGISALWNPNTTDRGGPQVMPDGSTLTERQRRLYGLDLVFSYRPLRNNQFKTLTWGTELLYSDNRYDVNPAAATPSTQTVGAFGMYSYLTYKFHREWTTGVQFEWVQSALNNKDETYAYSANITWALSHWNQLRLQYTHTQTNNVSPYSPSDAIYLQWAWIIGSHAHGWQQR